MLNIYEQSVQEVRLQLYKLKSEGVESVELKNYNFNNSFNKYLSLLLLECFNFDLKLIFKNCIFETKIDTESCYIIEFQKCNGDITIKGKNINEIKFMTNSFNKVYLIDTSINNLYISKKSLGEYYINNNYTKNIEIEEYEVYYFYKDVFIPPLFLFSVMSLYEEIIKVNILTFLFMFIAWYLLLSFLYSKEKLDLKKKRNATFENPIFKHPVFLMNLYTMMFVGLSKTIDFNVIFKYLNINELKFSANPEELTYSVFLTFLIFIIWSKFKNICFLMRDSRNITITSTEIDNFNYYTNQVGLASYIVEDIIPGKLELLNVKIKKANFKNFEGFDNKEKIFFLLERKNLYFDSFTYFHELNEQSDKENFDFILSNKNKIKISKNNLYSENNFFYYMGIKIYLHSLHFIYLLFIRIKNIFISLFLFYMLGIWFFSTENMTVTDTTSQVYIANYKNLKKDTPVFENIKKDKNTRIKLPDFYPRYSSSEYTIGRLLPFYETQQTTLFRPNNNTTSKLNMFYKLIGLIHGAAFLFIMTNRFVKIKK